MKRIKKIIQFTTQFLFLFIVIYCMLNYKLVQYGIMQGTGQLKIVWNVKPVEEILSDTSFPDSLKRRLKLVEEIKQFCFDSLGFNYSENYSTIYGGVNRKI